MTTPDPGLPNLNENRGYGDVIGPGEWNEAIGRINDVEDANADDTAILRGSTATGASTAAKVVTLADPNRVPVAGDLLLIEFTAGNTASTATLAVNGTPALGLTGASGSTSSAATTLAAGVESLVLHDGTTYRLLTGNSTIYSAFTVAELQAGSSGSGRIVTPALLAANLLNLAAAKPASSTAPGRAGQYWVDATGLYVCIATNTWRLIAGATF